VLEGIAHVASQLPNGTVFGVSADLIGDDLVQQQIADDGIQKKHRTDAKQSTRHWQISIATTPSTWMRTFGSA
jgi:hypothetical protein